MRSAHLNRAQRQQAHPAKQTRHQSVSSACACAKAFKRHKVPAGAGKVLGEEEAQVRQLLRRPSA
jgi:hypothetical protein